MENLATPIGGVRLTTKIVAAYVSSNHVAVASLPNLIASVHAALADLSSRHSASSMAGDSQPGPAQIRRSIQPDGLISFLDGRRYQTLKRHLATRGLDPNGYRVRFGLPDDYPMVAPSYSERRALIAKGTGLGTRRGRNG